MFYDDDIDICFDTDDFAECMTLEGESISAIFSFEEVLSDEGNRGQVFSREPSLTMAAHQAPDIAVNQVVVRANNDQYKVRSLYENASGVLEVALYKVTA